MNRPTLMLGLAGMALTLTTLMVVWWWPGPVVTTSEVVRRDMMQSVVVSGRVQNPFRLAIGSQVVGVVRGVPVREGQSVQANDLLIQLDDSESRAALAQAESAAAMAELQLRRVREVQLPLAEQGVRQSLINLEQAMRMQARHQDLFSQAFIGQAALDESSRTTRLSESQLVGAVHQWHSVRPGGAEHVQAQANLQQAQAGVALARARWSYARLRAPVAGTLIARQVEVGDVVQAGKVLMTLSPEGATQLVVQIDEKNLRLIALGQQALASADAYPQQKFKAQVAYINPGINAQTGAVEVKLDVLESVQTLRQDMTVSVDMEVARKPQALALQLSQVNDINGPAPWVWLLDAGHAVRRPLRLGLRGGAWVEVLDGLREGDAVIAMPNTLTNALREGQRVRAQP